MRKLLVGLGLLFLVLIACQTVPITGRQQVTLVPSSTVFAMSFDAYSDFLKKHKVIKDTKEAQMVKRVGANIQKAVENYFASQGMSDKLKDYKWEFNLVEDNQINAWCMAGGKVVVYTGLFNVVTDETSLAVVMGHEIAHAIAGHGEERLSHGLLVEVGGVALATALSQKPTQTKNLFLMAYGAGTTLGFVLPYSRLHEEEADRLGLIFMAMAGYDPQKALEFWQKMAEQKRGRSTPEFLSTHPSDATRIAKIQYYLPEAMQYYKGR